MNGDLQGTLTCRLASGMTQLTDDCFALDGPLLAVDEAVALISARVPTVAGVEAVALGDADGRVLADDIVAGVDLPPHDNSAVDGYAVRHADLKPADLTWLPVRGRIAAGQDPRGLEAAGAAVRIFTGALLPVDADTVFMQEDVRAEGPEAVFRPGLERGANRRRAGEDALRGTVVIPAGQRLRPQDVALAAAVGHVRLSVRRRVRVALLSTGDELAAAGAALGPGMIHDSNRIMLAALLRRLGVDVTDLGIVRDETNVLAERLREAAAAHDLVLSSGGVSVGEEDHVKAAVEGVGRLVFWRLAIKPGRSVAMGMIGGVPFVGLPGNPVAAYVTLLFLVRPLLARLGGAQPDVPAALPLPAAFAHRKKAGRREYLRVSLRRRPDGGVEAVKFPRDGSGILSSLTGSDGLAALPDELTEVNAGDPVPVYLHRMLWT